MYFIANQWKKSLTESNLSTIKGGLGLDSSVASRSIRHGYPITLKVERTNSVHALVLGKHKIGEMKKIGKDELQKEQEYYSS